ncbi:phosphatidylserine synthase, partial [Vibrio parahaemolyticus]|uniref:phospholipase D-like domain-containing protein n=1 Tax=Vibrio parahaemolyticus TaxID=670 RepID=UPI00116FA630
MELEVYFDALENSVMQELSKAKVYVKVAVAWITFQNYEQLFIDLSKKGVKIEILVSDSPQLRNNQMTTVNNLIKHGITVIVCKMPSSRNYMHHKFAVIDDSVVINGSFNWSANAAMSF